MQTAIKGVIFTDNDNLKQALLKRAVGFNSTEVTEEYSEDSDGELRMTKRKVVSKNVPPDVSAAKLLYELDGDMDSLKRLTDEELEKEKQRLLEILKENNKENL